MRLPGFDHCHKWLCAPKGSAFLYVRPEIQPLLEPLIVSWGWQSETPSSSRFIDEQEYTGTRDIAAYLATPAAIEFLEAHQWETVRERCHRLVVDAWQQLLALTGQSPLSSAAWFRQMAAIPLPPCDQVALKTRLYDEFGVESPISVWNGRPLLRVSIQGYNTSEDVERLVAAMNILLPQVRR